jgi:reverse gyrase
MISFFKQISERMFTVISKHRSKMIPDSKGISVLHFLIDNAFFRKVMHHISVIHLYCNI